MDFVNVINIIVSLLSVGLFWKLLDINELMELIVEYCLEVVDILRGVWCNFIFNFFMINVNLGFLKLFMSYEF